MRNFAERIRELDGELTLIGSGTPEQGREFQQRTDSPFRVLVDPDLVGYRAAELKQKLFGGFRVRTIPRVLGALRQGFRGFGTQGNPHQLGGVFVIDRTSELVYSYLSKTFDDRGDPREIVRVLKTARARPPAATGSGDVSPRLEAKRSRR